MLEHKLYYYIYMSNQLQIYDSELEKLTATYNQSLRILGIRLKQNIQYVNNLNIRRSLKIKAISNIRQQYNNRVKKLNSDYNNKKQQLTNMINLLLINNKKALLIGINYINTPNELYGCINDTNNLRELLVNNFHYTNFTILTDETNIKPTKQNIIDSLKMLLVNANSGDNLFFSYSGHGTCTIDMNSDELDGQDELIIPLDAVSINTCILDDELNNIIQTNLKPDVKLFMMFDSCFSGTVVDLKYNYMYDSELLVTNNNAMEINGEVFMISGCKDNQTSADTYVKYNNKNMSSGAMTYAFLKSIGDFGKNINFKNLIENMRNILKAEGYEQIPQLSSNMLVDINTKLFTL